IEWCRLLLMLLNLAVLSCSGVFCADQESEPFQPHTEQQDKKPFDLHAREDVLNPRTDLEIRRPAWLPGTAWTTRDLYLWSGSCRGTVGPFPEPVDERGKWKMDQSLVRFWPGRRPNPCKIRFKADPSAPPGNFTFTCTKPGGPCGWCVFLGYDSRGFPTYQYWFDMSRIGQ